MNLTLEERERLAYITNSPLHPLIVTALEGEEESRAQIEELEDQVGKHDDEVTKLEGQIEDKDTEIATLEEKLGHADETINELRADLEKKAAKSRLTPAERSELTRLREFQRTVLELC